MNLRCYFNMKVFATFFFTGLKNVKSLREGNNGTGR